MLCDSLDSHGDHPNVSVDGKLAEIRHGKHALFWRSYCILLESGKQPEVQQLSTEAQTLIVRCDLVPENNMASVVNAIQSYLKSVLVFDMLSDNDLRCIVTASDVATSIYFPHCRLIAKDIENIYNPSITKCLKELDVVVSPYRCIDSVSLYGSTDEKYLSEYNEQGELISGVPELSHLEYSQIDQGLLTEEDLTLDTEDPTETFLFWLPITLSIDYCRSITRSRQEVRIYSAVKHRGLSYTYNVTRLISNMPVEDKPFDLDFHLAFIQMWKVDRIVNVTYWKVIGQALYTLENGDHRGLNGWIGVLTQAYQNKGTTKPNHLTGQNIRKMCSDAYSTFKNGEIDIRSLAHYAKIDSPEKYLNWHDKWVIEALTGSMSGNEAVLGRAFWRVYWLDFMANVSDQRVAWYKHLHHRLVRDLSGISLRLLLSSNFLAYYTAMKSDVESQKQSLAVNPASCDLAIGMIDKIIDNLGRQHKKRDILGDLAERFSVPNMSSYIDADPSITLVKNGVLCVSGHSIIFRSGKPQDYLVKSFGASYMQDYSWSHPRVREVMRWSFITFIDKELITFFWKFLASLLLGGNNDKKLFFWSGPTANNMKTTWQLYVSLICGAKCMTMPISYFTSGKGSANSATPAEVRLEGARLMFSEEPENKVPFLLSIVKSEVGNAPRQIRGLFEDSRDINPQHKTVVVVNDPPPISKEPASEERVVIIKFDSRAMLRAPKTEEEQVKERVFPRDPLFDRKLPKMVDAGLWVMVQMFPYYSREGISNQPESVRKATAEYWNSIDKYVIFTRDNIVEDPSETLDPFVLYTEFFRWHERSYRRAEVPDKLTILKQMSKHIGDPDPTDGAWHGVSIRKN